MDILRFDGVEFDTEKDGKRLTKQYHKIAGFMKDGCWHTLREISFTTGAPEASASATLRDFRKKRFGENTVNRRRKGKDEWGIWEYQVIWNANGQQTTNTG